MTNTKEMPKYQCHKQVWALKIAQISEPTILGRSQLIFERGTYEPVWVEVSWTRKHQPKAGGYYVVYEDGYASFSPAEAFEKGYTPIDSLDSPPSSC